MKLEINLDEKQVAEAIIDGLKKHSLIGEQQNVTVIYNAESKDVLYTVSEVAKLIKCNPAYVYELIKSKLLPALKLGSLKVRRSSLLEFLEKHEGYDLTNPFDKKPIDQHSLINTNDNNENISNG